MDPVAHFEMPYGNPDKLKSPRGCHNTNAFSELPCALGTGRRDAPPKKFTAIHPCGRDRTVFSLLT